MVAGKRAEQPSRAEKSARKAANDLKTGGSAPKTSTLKLAEGAGVNMADEQERTLFFQDKGKYERLLAALKVATKAVQDHGKTIKANHGDHGLSAIKLAIKIQSSDEGEKDAKERIAFDFRVMRWLGTATGFQGNLFEEVDRRPGDELAYDRGKVAGMEGKGMKEFGYDESNANWQDAARGWHDGQAAIFNIKPLDRTAEVIKGEKPAEEAGGTPEAPDGEGTPGEPEENAETEDDSDSTDEDEEISEEDADGVDPADGAA